MPSADRGAHSVVFDDVRKSFRHGEVHDSLRGLLPVLRRQITRRARNSWELVNGRFGAVQDVSFRGSGVAWERVGGLLAAAAGFYPDFTGRETVFLQGAIMGMPRREITAKFDDTAAFADVVEFVDTPVKRYASGIGDAPPSTVRVIRPRCQRAVARLVGRAHVDPWDGGCRRC